jgi:hypothetical protein
MFYADSEHIAGDDAGASDGDKADASRETSQPCQTGPSARDGWKQQFSCSGDRLQEALDTYGFLGLEVKTVPLKELNCDGCTLCFDDETDETMMIFTRAKSD